MPPMRSIVSKQNLTSDSSAFGATADALAPIPASLSFCSASGLCDDYIMMTRTSVSSWRADIALPPSNFSRTLSTNALSS